MIKRNKMEKRWQRPKERRTIRHRKRRMSMQRTKKDKELTKNECIFINFIISNIKLIYFNLIL